MKAQTAPNKDVQREIADLGEVGVASLPPQGLTHETCPGFSKSIVSQSLVLGGMGLWADFCCPVAL